MVCFTFLYGETVFTVPCVFPIPRTSELALYLMLSRHLWLWLPSGWGCFRPPAAPATYTGLLPFRRAHQPPLECARLIPLKLFLLPGTRSHVCAQVSLFQQCLHTPPSLTRCYPASGHGTPSPETVCLATVCIPAGLQTTWGQASPVFTTRSPCSNRTSKGHIPFRLRKVL